MPAKLGELLKLLLETERNQLLIQTRGGLGQILQLRHADSFDHAGQLGSCVTESSDNPGRGCPMQLDHRSQLGFDGEKLNKNDHARSNMDGWESNELSDI